MTRQYRYALGVDLGIASIGTALVRLNEDGEPCGLLDAGVRIFNVAEGGAARRQARQIRKTLRRRRQRLRALVCRLQRAGFCRKRRTRLPGCSGVRRMRCGRGRRGSGCLRRMRWGVACCILPVFAGRDF